MKTGIHTLKEHTVAQWAYLAGIIDGEGSIYIGNFSSNPKTGTLHYQTNIEVTNTDEKLVRWLIDTFGGRLSYYTAKQTPKNSRKAVWRWIATGELLTHLCKGIHPYLLAKLPQCEIMLKMRETFKGTGAIKGKSGCQPVSQEILAIRKQYFDQMRALHCRNYTSK
jgi:hypothetical protein